MKKILFFITLIFLSKEALFGMDCGQQIVYGVPGKDGIPSVSLVPVTGPDGAIWMMAPVQKTSLFVMLQAPAPQALNAYTLVIRVSPTSQEEYDWLMCELDAMLMDGRWQQFITPDPTYGFTPLHFAMDWLNIPVLEKIFAILSDEQMSDVLRYKSEFHGGLIVGATSNTDGDTICHIALKKLASLCSQQQDVSALIKILDEHILPCTDLYDRNESVGKQPHEVFSVQDFFTTYAPQLVADPACELLVRNLAACSEDCLLSRESKEEQKSTDVEENSTDAASNSLEGDSVEQREDLAVVVPPQRSYKDAALLGVSRAQSAGYKTRTQSFKSEATRKDQVPSGSLGSRVVKSTHLETASSLKKSKKKRKGKVVEVTAFDNEGESFVEPVIRQEFFRSSIVSTEMSLGDSKIKKAKTPTQNAKQPVDNESALNEATVAIGAKDLSALTKALKKIKKPLSKKAETRIFTLLQGSMLEDFVQVFIALNKHFPELVASEKSCNNKLLIPFLFKYHSAHREVAFLFTELHVGKKILLSEEQHREAIAVGLIAAPVIKTISRDDLIDAIRYFKEKQLKAHDQELKILSNTLSVRLVSSEGRIESVAKVIDTDYLGALFYAIEFQEMQSVQYFLARIKNISALVLPEVQQSLLHIVPLMFGPDRKIEPFALNVLKEFCKHPSVKINQKSDQGSTPLHIAVTNQSSSELIGLLLANGADREAVDNEGYTPLDRLIEYLYTNHVPPAEALLCVKAFIMPTDTIEDLSRMSHHFMRITTSNVVNKNYLLFKSLCLECPELIASCLLQPFAVERFSSINAFLYSLYLLKKAENKDEQSYFDVFIERLLNIAPLVDWEVSLGEKERVDFEGIVRAVPVFNTVTLKPLVDSSGDAIAVKKWHPLETPESISTYDILMNAITDTLVAKCIIS